MSSSKRGEHSLGPSMYSRRLASIRITQELPSDDDDHCSLSELDSRRITSTALNVKNGLVASYGSKPKHRKAATTAESGLVCSVCGHAFRRLTALRDHMNIHTGQRPYICGYFGCKRAFKTASSQRVHERTHSGRLQFRCHVDNCTAIFKHKLSLRGHQQVKHGLFVQNESSMENIKRELVEESQSSSTTKRKQTEQQEAVAFENGSFKRFTCETCSVKFTQQQTLNRHVRIVHLNVKPHVCIECGAAFGTRYLLSRHNKIHSASRKSKTNVARKLQTESTKRCETSSVTRITRSESLAKRNRKDLSGSELSDSANENDLVQQPSAPHQLHQNAETPENEEVHHNASTTTILGATETNVELTRTLQPNYNNCTEIYQAATTSAECAQLEAFEDDYVEMGLEVDSDEEVQVFDSSEIRLHNATMLAQSP